MGSNTVSSLIESNMRTYALWLQAPAGESALPYTVGDLRLLLAPSCPAPGVLTPSDFVVTSSATPGYVTVSAGVGVTSPIGVTSGRLRERYLFASDGPVDVPVFTNAGGATRHHRLTVQVVDEQLPMGATSSPWVFRIYEDTGTPPTSNGQNAIALATVSVNPGQTSGYKITDLRSSSGHVMACAVSGVASGHSAISTIDIRQPLHYASEVDDPWHMADLTTDQTAITVRTDGYYDLYASTEIGTPISAYMAIYLNYSGTTDGSILAAIIPETELCCANWNGGAWGQSHVLNYFLHAGDTIRACVMSTVTANIVKASMRVIRREVRS